MLQSLRALVIDDEQQVREFMCTVLEADGWMVSRAASAEDAFEMLGDENWAVVFCDVMLGGADGFAVLRRFKEALPETTVVLMTGHGSAAGALDATAFGAYDYLLKPFGVEELQSAFQVKLLRVLQEGEIRRVGSNQTQRVDVRVIAASNRNVEAEVAAGRFREDLFYRLNAVSITLPPLRERREDIPPLAQTFAKRLYSLNPSVRFSAEALALLECYPWPGNIRELENAVVRAAAMSDGIIRVQDLPERIRNYREAQAPDAVATADSSPATGAEWVSLSEIEGRYVARVLKHTGGNKQAASRLLGVDRKKVDRMIRRHKLFTSKVAGSASAR